MRAIVMRQTGATDVLHIENVDRPVLGPHELLIRVARRRCSIQSTASLSTSLVQKVRNARPDILLMLTTNVPDTKLVLEKFKTKANEPWMPQDSISTYGDMWIFKDAMEKAGSADPRKVAAAIRGFDESGGAAKYFPGPAGLRILQWS